MNIKPDDIVEYNPLRQYGDTGAVIESGDPAVMLTWQRHLASTAARLNDDGVVVDEQNPLGEHLRQILHEIEVVEAALIPFKN